MDLSKKQDEYLGLEQKVQQIVGHRKISMTNTWELNKKYNKVLDVGKKYNKYLKVEQKVGQKLQSSVKSITYTFQISPSKWTSKPNIFK